MEFSILDRGCFFTPVVIKSVLFLFRVYKTKHLCLYTPSSPSHTHCPSLPHDGSRSPTGFTLPWRDSSNMLSMNHPNRHPFFHTEKG